MEPWIKRLPLSLPVQVPLLLILSVWGFTLSAATTSLAGEWKAGLARACLTPAQYMPMAGYASRGAEHATGRLTDLWAKVLVIEDASGTQAALITLDLIGIDRRLSDALAAELKKEFGWQRSQIAFCTSHTHSGPVVKNVLLPLHYLNYTETDQKLIAEYESFLKASLLESIRQAVKNLAPATLSWNHGKAEFAVNRRENREQDVPTLREKGELKGPVDHDVPVLVVKQDQKVTAIVFGYACHNTTLSGMEWSGDYAGQAQIELEKTFPGTQAMYWAGCGADQNPVPRRSVELAAQYGRQLADAVTAVVNGPLLPITPELHTQYETVPVPFGHVPDQKEIEKAAASANIYEVARAKYQLAQLSKAEQIPTSYDYPVQVWKLGKSVAFVLLGGEVVVDYALRLKTDIQMENEYAGIWCAGYANDVMAYIPSRRVLLEGGYEGGGSMVYYGQPGPWAPEIEDLIVQKARELSRAK